MLKSNSRLMDLPEFLTHGNLYHMQQIILFKEGKLKTKPVWKDSLKNYCGRVSVLNKLCPPVQKVVDQMIQGYKYQYPGTTHSVTEHIFDTWWDVVHGDYGRGYWQTKPNQEVQDALKDLRKDSRLTLVQK